ncbi:MAG: hypothetical protein Q7R65_03460 [bacterium]|nr:hypothetical protein [bacterium]
MNPELAEDFINKNANKILRLFSMYQIIEMMLFSKLFPSNLIPNLDNEGEFNKFSKSFTSRTLGKMTKEYSKKYPNDECKLLDSLKEITPQRNMFMHSMWILLSVCDNQAEASRHGEFLIEKFDKRATKLFHTLANKK